MDHICCDGRGLLLVLQALPKEALPVTLGVTVDLRCFLDEPSGVVAKRTGVAFASLSRVAAEPAEVTLAQVVSVMEDLTSRGPGLATALLFESLPRLGLAAVRSWFEGRDRSDGGKGAPPLLSNVGDVSVPQGGLSFGETKASGALSCWGLLWLLPIFSWWRRPTGRS
jgi:NRPS condensation-like uncharacterized protein